MITVEQRSKFLVVVGSHYLSKVSALLQERGVVNRNNKPHEGSMISMVLRGERKNPAIADAILTILRIEEERLAELSKNLNTKKPKVAASGV